MLRDGFEHEARRRILTPATRNALAAQNAASVMPTSSSSATAMNNYYSRSASPFSKGFVAHTTLPTHGSGDPNNPLKRPRSPSLEYPRDIRHEKRLKMDDGGIVSASKQPSALREIAKQHSKPLAKRRRAMGKELNINDDMRSSSNDQELVEVERGGSSSGSGELSYAESRSSTSSLVGYGSDSNSHHSDSFHSTRAEYMARPSSQSSLRQIFSSIERSINSRQNHLGTASLSSQ
ncbi:hypothetical protein M408DRAFT_207941 [Serendipita vermifera MAFF 305830]|uniref:Uncharacterized protein n=1 Tax=Serendipita vermifera MAFF 305830 TaxID=933852 RepID=A0A0C2X8H1_SERVB|nr:hypothetical protein M408DRAFT_207941 [Serendipita vermifera MAFF 305830]